MNTKQEAARLTKKSIRTARDNYKVRKIINEIFDKEFFEELIKPGLIADKEFALEVCNALITLSINRGAMEAGSIMHIMGRQLMDYIRREK